LPGRLRRTVLLALALLTVSLGLVGNAGAQLTPPWCGTPMPDAAGNLPDGSDPSHPVGSFPHIPYYAIKCTLDQIESQEVADRMSIEQIGVSALGRPLYGVVINALETPEQRRDFSRWQQVRELALDDPARAQELLAQWGSEIKVPIFNQSGIHGNEYEGVESNMQLIEELATTPYGVDPKIDSYLDHVIMVFNIIQNPDGRIAGARANGNGFDLNRDYLTQSQRETKASVALQQEWLAPEALDLHGYVTPTLVESTTKPHNPGIEYDLYIQWNQRRSDANEAGLASVGLGTTRPVNDWCPEADFPGPSGFCEDGVTLPGPATAEGWDDWGPFYTGQYAQLTGFDSSTVEMCNRTDFLCGLPGSTTHQRGRLGAYLAQRVVTLSTMDFMVANRNELLWKQMEVYRRGVTGADRPACCPAPFDQNNNWMTEYPTAHVIPMGNGQRSDSEANRLVEWLLANGIKVHQLMADYTFGGQTFERGSYVVWMNQALRGLANTALKVGDDISASITQLYAPPAAWSHGWLWGADMVEIPDNAAFSPLTTEIPRPRILPGGVEAGLAETYALELDSATAVRALNSLSADGILGELALEPFAAQTGGTLPAGSVLFDADPATRVKLATVGRENAITFRRIVSDAIPDDTDRIEGAPRIAVLTGAVNQDVWSLRNLGFVADPVSTATINTSPTDPLVNYDLIWNTGNWPGTTLPTARERLTAFFTAGGGYIGTGVNGANFLHTSAQTSGLTVVTSVAPGQPSVGESGIIRWLNEGGASSPITGAYPPTDTAIVDPPIWFSSVPASHSVDARLATTNFFLAGLWHSSEPDSASAPGSPFVVHGSNVGGTARLVNFAMSPLYRADPQREWPMVGAAAYWADQ
jgi:Zinc carboxypeptidase